MPPKGTWEALLSAAIRAAGVPPRPLGNGECTDGGGERCPLCRAAVLTYADEARLKASAFPEFWRATAPGCTPEALVPSPAGRGYRSVTKRKAFPGRRGLTLGLIDARRSAPFRPILCAIEPSFHAPVYAHIEEALNAPWAAALAAAIQYVILRGDGPDLAVILNLRTLESHPPRAATTLSKSLTRRFPAIRSVFLFDGGGEERYYLGSADPITPRRFRKLFGDPWMSHRVGRETFLYSPFSFSQVNHSILPPFLAAAERLLAPSGAGDLLDLYSGYGLFGLSLAHRFGRVTGIELSVASVQGAVENARRRRTRNIRFLRSAVNAVALDRTGGGMTDRDAVILDPPRAGTEGGVIEAIAARRPGRVLHIFCNPDLIGPELARWTTAGYRVRGAIPFDMFPGTADIEVMVLLT